MTVDEFPPAAPVRPLWLLTLADLALLLVGSLLLLQALRHEDPARVAAAIRHGFTTDATVPLAAAAIDGFAPGRATLPREPVDVVAWARDTLGDPRATLSVAGSTDGTPADVDAATGSAAILAADRARSVVAALVAGGVAPGRIAIGPSVRTPGHRTVAATIVFAGKS